jgi:hypothetical protein
VKSDLRDPRAQSKYLNNENNAEDKPRKIKMTFVSQNRAKDRTNAGANAEPKVPEPKVGPKPQTKTKLKFSSEP